VSVRGTREIVLKEEEHVLSALAEWRNRNLDDVETIVQVLPKRASADLRA
jgi:hypothetical protein